jgi:hypothetical protein
MCQKEAKGYGFCAEQYKVHGYLDRLLARIKLGSVNET